MNYPIPFNEEERIAELHRLKILDTLGEEAYDDLTKLTTKIFGTPIAYVSLIDTERMWLKSVIGLDIEEVDRDLAFCSYTIMDEDPLIVENATLDERFKDNPFVVEEDGIKFYAGAPLKTTRNFLLGSLCIVDQKPRKMSDEEIEILEILAKQVGYLIELREIRNKLKDQEEENLRLHQLLPMCTTCKNVKDIDEYWQDMKSHVEQLDNSRTRQAACPSCGKEIGLDEELY